MGKTSPPSRKRQDNRAYWQRHIEKQKKSGTTQTAYCLDQRIKKTTFQYWKYRIKREGNSRSLVPVMITSDVDTRSFDINKIPEQGVSSTGIHLSIKGRFIMELEEQFSASALSKLIGILEAL